MALQADNQGFLIGEVVSDIRRAIDQLSGIRSDVAAIKRAILGNTSSSGTGSRSSSGGSNQRPARQPRGSSTTITTTTSTVTPNGRGTGNQQSSASINQLLSDRLSDGSQAAIPAQAGRSNTRDASGRFTSNNSTTVTPGGRDAAGRFTSGSSRQAENQQQAGLLNGLADRIGSAIGSGSNDLDNVDPTIQAFNEVAEPMRRGYQALFGGGDKKERWFRRIFGELKLFRRDESVFNRAANRSLHNIEDNPGGGGEEGGRSFTGALLGSISPWVLTAITGIGSALISGIGAVLGVIFSPIGLAIGAAALLAWGLFTESGQKFFGDIGANIIAGWGVITTAFEPISSYIGDQWSKVTLAFEPITTSISESWDSITGNFNSVIDGMLSSWNAFTGFLKDKFGIDLPAIFKPVADIGKKVIDSAKSGIDAVGEKASSLGNKANDYIKDKTGFNAKESASNAVSSVKSGINSIADKATDGATKIASRATGKQSTNKAAMISEMVSQGITDTKEQAMLMAQVDHESGGFTYTKELGKDSYFDKYDADTKKGRELGNTEMGDGAKYKGRGFMQLTGKSNYAAAGKDLGLDLVNHPELAESPENAAKTAMWYWKKNKLGAKAKQGDVEGATKIINGGTNGLANRKEKFNEYLGSAEKGEFTESPSKIAENKPQASPVLPSNAPSTISISSTIPTSPRIPTAPAIADSPGVIIPMASNTEQRPSANAPSSDVGRDLKDRGIAHIVTGGFSGPG